MYTIMYPYCESNVVFDVAAIGESVLIHTHGISSDFRFHQGPGGQR